MSKENQNANVNREDHPHQEGEQQNTPVSNIQAGNKNNAQPMSNMMNESEEQRAGKAHGQKDERGVQQDQRLP